ncbi:MAG: pyridoxamine 5'-phosphate oxidase family protein [Clostridia bacterium]|nr:pyridoxamine 5'-phosphate oxidase family protein [Clostridia bacterium]
MRRRDREITDKAKIAGILMRAQAMSLAFAGEPYVIPMNYGFTFDGEEFRLYIHGASEGKKDDRMLTDPRVAFCVYTDNRVYRDMDEEYTSSFDSVCGEGVVTMLRGEDKVRALSAIMAHYAPGREFVFDARTLVNTMAAEITVTKITGKHHD